MQHLTSSAALAAFIKTLKAQGKTIGFVPTMGALHDGHLSLVTLAKRHADSVIVSIFVNPAQFAPHEDFDAYPRQQEQDCQKLMPFHVDAVYLPSKDDIYPKGTDETFSVGEIGTLLEGKPRPHFFNGVGQVVLRLFEQVQPDVAVFGEKDYQQLTIIKKLVREHSLPVEILSGVTLREPDGLAMSSRNVYLSPQQRSIAPALYQTLQNLSAQVLSGKAENAALASAANHLLASGFDSVDYIEIRDALTLSSWNKKAGTGRILAAARLGKTRLIDNIPL